MVKSGVQFELSDGQQRGSERIRAGRFCLSWTAASYTSIMRMELWISPVPASAFELLPARN